MEILELKSPMTEIKSSTYVLNNRQDGQRARDLEDR